MSQIEPGYTFTRSDDTAPFSQYITKTQMSERGKGSIFGQLAKTLPSPISLDHDPVLFSIKYVQTAMSFLQGYTQDANTRELIKTCNNLRFMDWYGMRFFRTWSQVPRLCALDQDFAYFYDGYDFSHQVPHTCPVVDRNWPISDGLSLHKFDPETRALQSTFTGKRVYLPEFATPLVSSASPISVVTQTEISLAVDQDLPINTLMIPCSPCATFGTYENRFTKGPSPFQSPNDRYDSNVVIHARYEGGNLQNPSNSTDNTINLYALKRQDKFCSRLNRYNHCTVYAQPDPSKVVVSNPSQIDWQLKAEMNGLILGGSSTIDQTATTAAVQAFAEIIHFTSATTSQITRIACDSQVDFWIHDICGNLVGIEQVTTLDNYSQGFCVLALRSQNSANDGFMTSFFETYKHTQVTAGEDQEFRITRDNWCPGNVSNMIYVWTTTRLYQVTWDNPPLEKDLTQRFTTSVAMTSRVSANYIPPLVVPNSTIKLVLAEAPEAKFMFE